ncbi:manganese efflux pump [Methanoplanus sp. FWC-SCC4]|uniref:Putative manganese efflux pump MntP n=1 Tax=Methanochimaera problematica TaxID=2609417 RepID=A0AA97I3X9_9EURY|nr:manganese efflux pump MntP family protein [Methanoplanus sp. FWC-SCC4]WOF15736.1 manganese efflux pump [Methanoplanus sp. FWC-SCC4]
MSFFSVLAIAIGLSMDSFAVSVSAGTAKTLNKSEKFKNSLKLGTTFGFFQAFMPVIGWITGVQFQSFVISYAHWIAFILLSAIGCKMIFEALSDNGEDSGITGTISLNMLILLGIATSIDALAVGFSFAFLNEAILIPAIIIGIVTFSMSFAGVYLGEKFGEIMGERAEIIGGIILIVIGVKILLENL